jgi:L-amino acid N-acyltransferase YncA
MNFRNATIDDLSTIVEIYNSTISSGMVTADTEPVTVESRMTWFKAHKPNKRPLWVVENNNKEIVGWVSYQSFYGRPAYDATAEISIYLRENAREKGLGSEILQLALEHAKKIGIKTVLGFIFSHNEPSIRLVKRFGFAQWGFFPKVAEINGTERDLVIMGKRVE